MTKKNYQVPKSEKVMLFSQITMQQFGVAVGSAINGGPGEPIQTE